MFKKFSLNFKLQMMFAVGAMNLLIVGAVGFNALKEINKIQNQVISVNYPNLLYASKMLLYANDSMRFLLQLNLPGNDAKETERLTGKIKEELAAFEKENEEYLKIDFLEGEKEVYDAFYKEWKTITKLIDETLPIAMSNNSADALKFAEIYRGEFRQARDKFVEKNKEFADFQRSQVELGTKKASQVTTFQSNLAILLVGLGFILSLLMGFFFSRSLSKNLVNMSNNLVAGASQVKDAATEIANSSESLSSSTSEQAAAVQETSSAVEELSAMVSKNSDNAQKSQEKAHTSQDVAQKGSTVVTEMIHAISDINESNNNIMAAVEESNRNIADISRVIMEIGAKTTVIKDIVFQTKLLSFNASVEAARAGEHGKGFSVVAEEVGNLAQMSGNAAQEISSTLEGSIKKVNQIVVDTKNRVEGLILSGKEKVQKGHQIATQCGEILAQILMEASDVNSMVVEISGASKEQAIGIQEITKAMSQMDMVTQQNASASQTAASAAVELAAQAESMSSIVQEMQTLIYGAGKGDQTPPSSGHHSKNFSPHNSHTASHKDAA